MTTVRKTDDDNASDELQLVSLRWPDRNMPWRSKMYRRSSRYREEIIHVPDAESHVMGILTLETACCRWSTCAACLTCPAGKTMTTAASSWFHSVVVGCVVMDASMKCCACQSPTWTPCGTTGRDVIWATFRDCVWTTQAPVSIISANNLFRHSAVKEALTTVETFGRRQ